MEATPLEMLFDPTGILPHGRAEVHYFDRIFSA
jgi:hypothetical protein